MCSFPSFPTSSACSILTGMPARKELSSAMGCSADPPHLTWHPPDGTHKGKEGAKENVVSPSFLYLGFLPSVFNALLLGLDEASFCYRLTLLDVKLADKKRYLGECLLGKLDAILTLPYG